VSLKLHWQSLLISAAIQILKSSTLSLFVSMITMITGAIISHTCTHDKHFLGYTERFYYFVMISATMCLGISMLMPLHFSGANPLIAEDMAPKLGACQKQR
jgi:hypothetical protein